MKNNFKGFGRSFAAVVVMLCMLFSMLAPTIMAAGEGQSKAAVKEDKNYVSIGDSMTNGYGLENGYNTPGYKEYSADAYPNKFADYLANEYNVNHSALATSGTRVEDLLFLLTLDTENSEVQSFFEAASLARGWADAKADFNRLFSVGDKYTYEEMINGYWTKGQTGGTLAVAKAYQKAVTEADIITLGIGNANFGVFFFQRLVALSGLVGTSEAGEYRAQDVIDRCESTKLKIAFQLVYEQVEKYFGEFVPELEAAGMKADTIEEMKELFLYTAMSYVDSYTKVLNKIVALNNDAANLEVVLVANFNAYEGIGLTDGNEDFPISMERLIDAMIVPTNAFMASAATYLQVSDKEMDVDNMTSFYYAEAHNLKYIVSTMTGEVRDMNQTLADAFFKNIVGDNGDGMVWSIAKDALNGKINLVNITIDEIVAFIKAIKGETDLKNYINTTNADVIASCAVYYGFEKAIIASTNAKSFDIGAVTSLVTGDLGSVFNPIMNAIDNNPAVNEDRAEVVYEIAADTAKDEIIDQLVIDFAATGLIANDLAELVVYGDEIKAILDGDDTAAEAIADRAIALMNTNRPAGTTYEDNKATIVTSIKDGIVNEEATINDSIVALSLPEIIAGSVDSDDADAGLLKGLLHLFARNIIGDGVGAHPNADDHTVIANAVINAYGNSYTTIEKMVDVVVDLIVRYYDDAYALAYEAAEKLGYFESVKTGVDNTVAKLKEIVSALKSGNVSAVSAVTAADPKDEAVAAIEEAIALLVDLKNAIENATIEDANEIILQIKATVSGVQAQLAIADANIKLIADDTAAKAELAYNAAVAAVNELTVIINETVEAVKNAAYDKIDEVLGASYDQIAAYIINIVEDYSPETAEYLEKLFTEAPGKVIEFVKDKAAAIDEYINNSGIGAVIVMAYTAYTEGTEALNKLMENEKFKMAVLALGYIVTEYGYVAWNFVVLYGDVTGYTDRIINAYETVKGEVKEKIAALESALKEIKAKLGAEIAEKKVVLAELYAQYAVAAGEAKEALLAEIRLLEAEIRELEEELDEHIAIILEEITNLSDNVDDIIDEIEIILGEVAELEYAIIDFAKALAENSAERIELAADKIKAALDKLENVSNKVIDKAVAKLETKIPEVVAIADKISDKAAALGVKADGYVDAVSTELLALIDEFVVAADALAAHIALVTEEVPETLRDFVAVVRSTYEKVVGTLMELYEESISAEYKKTNGSYYVALGDIVLENPAPGYSYADRLANFLRVGYKDLSDDDIITKDMLDVIAENAADIEKADLVTIGFSNAAIFKYAAPALATGEVDVDWSDIFGAEVADIADRIIAELREIIVQEVEVSMVGNVVDLLEAYVYAYVSHVVTLPEVVASVKELSPDALVVVVGAYNEFGDAVVNTSEFQMFQDFGIDLDVELELGKYFGYVTKALNVEALLTAMHYDATIYVDAYEVENKFDDNHNAVVDAIFGDPKELLPTTNGHRYIFMQIADAIGAFSECQHIYDNACDAFCNICGYERDVIGHIYSADCDATCNVCGDERENVAEHTWGEWTTTRVPTINVMGERVRTCTACNEAKQYELIPVTVVTVDTDDVNIGLIVAIVIPSLLALGAGAFAVVWFGVKKKSWADLKVATVKVTGNVVSAIKKVFKKA